MSILCNLCKGSLLPYSSGQAAFAFCRGFCYNRLNTLPSPGGKDGGGKTMDEKHIRRIGELARKSRTPAGLTEAEKAEQAALRREYIDSMKKNLRTQLDNIELIDEYGVHRPLPKKS